MNRIRRAWDLLIAGAAAAAAGLWLPGSIAKEITAELITFFGIQSAVILPAMIFTAGILRPGGLSLPEAKRYRAALRQQMTFWAVLLALDFLTVCLLIIGKASTWSLSIPAVQPITSSTYDISWLLIALTAFLGVLAILRTIPFVQGVLSLHELNSDLTEKAIKSQNQTELEKLDKRGEADQFKTPTGFGKVVKRG